MLWGMFRHPVYPKHSEIACKWRRCRTGVRDRSPGHHWDESQRWSWAGNAIWSLQSGGARLERGSWSSWNAEILSCIGLIAWCPLIGRIRAGMGSIPPLGKPWTASDCISPNKRVISSVPELLPSVCSRFRGFQGCLPARERIVPKGDLGSATGWMKRFVGMLNLAAAFHPNRSHFAPVWEDKGARNEREWDFSA